MRSAIKQKVLDLLTNAVIIDDDFSFLNVKDSVDLDNVLRSEPYAGKAPMKGTLRYERSEPDSDDPVAGDDRYKMKKLRGFLELFKNAGILPIPLFYTEEQEQEKSMIRACMNLTDFSVVDYSLINKDTSGITIIKENIENPDLINPVIIFTKGDKGRVERALEIDGDFERVSTFVTPPCFRHKKHPGLFIHVYCKTEFDPAPARDNLAEYIISHFELYSILVMAFNSQCRKKMRAIEAIRGDHKNDFSYSFFLLAKFLEGYSFKVLDFSHPITMYPVKVTLDELIADEVQSDQEFEIQNENEFIPILGKVLNSERIKDVVGSIIRLSSEQ